MEKGKGSLALREMQEGYLPIASAIACRMHWFCLACDGPVDEEELSQEAVALGWKRYLAAMNAGFNPAWSPRKFARWVCVAVLKGTGLVPRIQRVNRLQWSRPGRASATIERCVPRLALHGPLSLCQLAVDLGGDPAQLAQLAVDTEAFLKTLSRRERRWVKRRLAGDGFCQAARAIGLDPSSCRPIRENVRQAWRSFFHETEV